MGNQGLTRCEVPVPNAERNLRVEDGAGACIGADWFRKGQKAPSQLIPQYSCFHKDSNNGVQTVGNVDEQPLELLTDLNVLSQRPSDAVSPHVSVNILPGSRPDRRASHMSHPGARKHSDPVVQNLCEAFQRCSSSSHLASDRGAEGNPCNQASNRRLGMVAALSRELSSDIAASTAASRRSISEAATSSSSGPLLVGRWAEYEGTVDEDGRRHGSGILIWPDGRRYEGQFEHGVLQGHACMSWPNGQNYVGQYFDNLKHGAGVFTWSDGRRYSGQWQHGRRHGCGVYTNAKGETHGGVWHEDRPLHWDPPEHPGVDTKAHASTKEDGIEAPVGRQRARAGGA